MIRRAVVEYKTEGEAPVVTLEGQWNRRMIDQLPVVLIRALKISKHEQAKRLLKSNVTEEKKDGRRSK